MTCFGLTPTPFTTPFINNELMLIWLFLVGYKPNTVNWNNFMLWESPYNDIGLVDAFSQFSSELSRKVLCLISVCPGRLLRTSRPATEPFRLIIQQSVRGQWQWQGHVYNITRIWNSHNNIIDNKIWKIIQPFKKPQIAKKNIRWENSGCILIT